MNEDKLKDILVRSQRTVEMAKFDSLMNDYLDAIVSCATKGKPHSLHQEAKQALREHFWKATTMCMVIDKKIEELEEM